MNITDAESVIIEMQATWPQRAFDEAQTIVWLKTLEPLPVDVARAAVDTLRKTLTFMPSHAEFTTAAEAERKLRLIETALPSASTSCPECHGDRMVELRPSIYRPCSRCLATEFTRWAEGHYSPRHNDAPCAECAVLKSGGDRARDLTADYQRRAAANSR